MTTAVLSLPARRTGILAPTRSTGESESAKVLEEILEGVRDHLLSSVSIRSSAESALVDLEGLQIEAATPGWNGYDGQPVSAESVDRARYILEALPTSLPQPEISASSDGEVALDWRFGQRGAFTMTVGGGGRLTFAWMIGPRTFSGIDWLDDGIPAPIIQALSTLTTQTER